MPLVADGLARRKACYATRNTLPGAAGTGMTLRYIGEPPAERKGRDRKASVRVRIVHTVARSGRRPGLAAPSGRQGDEAVTP